jgi:tripartite motif-containing protein 9/67
LTRIQQRQPPPAPPLRRSSSSLCGGPRGLDDVPGSGCGRQCDSGDGFGDYSESSDSFSITSDTDSGVVCVRDSVVPKRAARSSSVGNLSSCRLTESCATSEITCPVCTRVLPLTSKEPASLFRRNTALASVVLKHSSVAKLEQFMACQLCEDGDRQPAVVFCVQCKIAYCSQCRDRCHPPRGPLASHQMVAPSAANRHGPGSVSTCEDHPEEVLSTYCTSCNVGVCCLCTQSSKHVGHPVQALGALCKARKVCV